MSSIRDKSVSVLFLLGLFFLANLPKLQADESKIPSIPLVRYDCLHRLLGGSWSDVWTFKWPDADKALFTDSIRSAVEKDFATTLQPVPPFSWWKTPLVLGAAKRNPKNGLVYFLLEPANGDMVMDGNVVYIYDPENHWWICKTTVSLSE